MIAQVMAYCKNHFWRSYERDDFSVVSDGIEGAFGNTYIVGQYIHVAGSFVNDGVYKITTVSDTKLTLDATLTEESTDEGFIIYGCAVPSDFLSVVSDIETWLTTNSGQEGVASESLGNHSISYATGADGSTSNNWKSAFSGRLLPYKQVYETYENYYLNRRRW